MITSDEFDFIEVRSGTNLFRSYLDLRCDAFAKEIQRVTGASDHQLHCLKTDKYDRHSRHILALHKPTGKPAGTARLILPNPHGLSIESRYNIHHKPESFSRRKAVSEISRMAIAPEFRAPKKLDDDSGYINLINKVHRLNITGYRNYSLELVIGLYRKIYQIAREEGHTHSYAAMEASFFRLLKRFNFKFTQVGDSFTHAGRRPRRPYLLDYNEMAHLYRETNPELLDFFTKDTEHTELSETLRN
ncbi:MAG: PEP-CTERM/exosortase system-associated acyltransferase [Chromatiales bacterium]|jgi:N-acyl amino acid synthase of PEP-CTERM/exosortase system